MASPPPSSEPLNLLFITCDQWRADCLSVAGHPVLRTPALDALAAEGVRFGNHFGQSVPCSPGRASLYTGMYTMNNGVNSNQAPLNAGHTNWAKELRTLGYEPVLAGYTDISSDPRGKAPGDPTNHMYGELDGLHSLEPIGRAPDNGTYLPLRRSDSAGSSIMLDMCDSDARAMRSGWAAWLEELGYKTPKEMFVSPKSDEGNIYMRGTWPGGRQNPPFEDAVADSDYQFVDVHKTEPPSQFAHKRHVGNDGHAASAFYKAEHSDSAYVVNSTMRHVRARHGAPWACHCSFFKPHPPWLNPKPFSENYHPECGHIGLRDARTDSKKEQAGLHPWLQWRLTHPSQVPTVAPENEDDLALLRSQYWASCAEVDDQLGRLFGFLKERGEWDRTLVVFTADHAEQLGEHWLLSKTGFFDGSYHLPLIVRDPRPCSDSSRGALSEALTEAVDVMPTILEAMGVAIPAQVDGQSLTPFLTMDGQVPEYWRTAVHWEFDFRGDDQTLVRNPYDANLAVLRRKDVKFVHFAAEELPMLLFDLTVDEHEMVNVATQPEYAAVLMDCMNEMLRWRARHREHSLSYLSVGAGGASPKYPTLHEAVSQRALGGERGLPKL